MRGLISATGTVNSPWPVEISTAKSLLPVCGKPLIQYSIDVLREMGIRDILIVVDSLAVASFQKVLGAGHEWGLKLSYALQSAGSGIVEDLMLGEEFVGNSSCCLICGDKVFLNTHVSKRIDSSTPFRGAHVCIRPSASPHARDFETSLYIFDSTVFRKMHALGAASTGMADLLELYQNEGRLSIEEVQPKSNGWLDVHTPESLIQAGMQAAAIAKDVQGR